MPNYTTIPVSLPYGSGAQLYVGYGLENQTTPGVPVAPSNYLPVEADQVNFTFDPGRVALELSTGDLYKDFIQVEYQAKGTGSLEYPLFPTVGQDLLGYCGLVSGGTPGAATGALALPEYITFYIGRVAAEEVYPGCRCKMITVTATSTKPLMVKLEFEFVARPLVSGQGAPPASGPPYLGDVTAGTYGLNQPTFSAAYTQEVPYLWGGVSAVTLLSTVSSVQMDTIEISISYELVSFYGNHGSNLPSELIPAGVTVAGKFTKLFTDPGEYNIFNEACSAVGPLDFNWTDTCNNTSHAIEILLPKAFYKKQSFKNPMKGAITEDYEIGTIKTNVSPYSPLLYAFN